jgi:hypothetical protein
MFNENKYKKCINQLIGVKIAIVICYMLVFAVAGGIIGYEVVQEFINDKVIIIVSIAIGILVGFILGLCSTWRVEMKIQEAYWRIDTLNELKKQNSSKTNSIAKTVVAIENKQLSNPEENKLEEKKSSVVSKTEE